MNPASRLYELMNEWNINASNASLSAVDKQVFLYEICTAVARLTDALNGIPGSDKDVDLVHELLQSCMRPIFDGDSFRFDDWKLRVIEALEDKIASTQPFIPPIDEEMLVSLRRSFEEILACSGNIGEQFSYLGDSLGYYAERGINITAGVTAATVDLVALRSVTFALTGVFATLLSLMFASGTAEKHFSDIFGRFIAVCGSWCGGATAGAAGAILAQSVNIFLTQ